MQICNPKTFLPLLVQWLHGFLLSGHATITCAAGRAALWTRAEAADLVLSGDDTADSITQKVMMQMITRHPSIKIT